MTDTKLFAERIWKTSLPTRGERSITLTVKAQIAGLMGQSPHFSVTAETSDGCCGMLHEEIRQAFGDTGEADNPSSYLRWHLTSITGPLHYEANTLYWAGFSEWSDGPNWTNALTTCVYGAARGDEAWDPRCMDKEALVRWLRQRKPALMAAFRRDMETLFGQDLTHVFGGA